MTLSLASLSSSGIVLTADSRQTYSNNAGMTRIGTDNANKLFQLTAKAGVVIAGKAFFNDSKGVLKSTGWFIEQFKKEVLKAEWTTEEIANNMNTYFIQVFINPEEVRLKQLFEKDITDNIGGTEITFDQRENLKVHYSYLKDGERVEKDFYVESLSFIVAGIDQDGIGRAYTVYVPNVPTAVRDTEFGGSMWIGQTDVIGRIVKGKSWEIDSLPFVLKAKDEGINTTEELEKAEYIINWGLMTLQDSIDFCVLITRITESIQRFSDGTFMNPGGITGVGGPVDVATLTVDDGFKWISQKVLTVD